jgi:hypothetical protein
MVLLFQRTLSRERLIFRHAKVCWHDMSHKRIWIMNSKALRVCPRNDMPHVVFDLFQQSIELPRKGKFEVGKKSITVDVCSSGNRSIGRAAVVLVKSPSALTLDRRMFDCACACIRSSNDILGVANVIAVGCNLLVVVVFVVVVTTKDVVAALWF